VSGLRGLVLGVAGLSLAEAVVSRSSSTNNAGAAVTLLSHGLARWLNPFVPLIPDLHAGASTSGSASKPSASFESGGSGSAMQSVSTTMPAGAGAGVSTGTNI